jgi:hypothetical protein
MPSNFATLREKLAAHPIARVEETEEALTVLPATPAGFPVTLRKVPAGYQVSFEGWHEDFDTEDEAIACFGFGLSNRCRLAITFRGASPVRWTVESLRDGAWSADSTTALIFTPFWRPKRVEHRSNDLLGAPTQAEAQHVVQRLKTPGPAE